MAVTITGNSHNTGGSGMKKLVIIGAAIGLTLGILQLFYVRTTITKYGEPINSSATCNELTAACGYCPEGAPIQNGLCYSKGHIQRYRGFPLSPKSGFNEDKLAKTGMLYANVAIFVIAVPLLLWLLIRVLGKPFRRKKQAKKLAASSPTASEKADSGIE